MLKGIHVSPSLVFSDSSPCIIIRLVEDRGNGQISKIASVLSVAQAEELIADIKKAICASKGVVI